MGNTNTTSEPATPIQDTNFTEEAKSCTIDEFIGKLQSLKHTLGGNYPVLFWDQFSVCKMDINEMCQIDYTHGRLLIGGFHHDAEAYYNLDENDLITIIKKDE